MTTDDRLETDYLVVGAGTSGMGFVDALIEHSDADVIMVDRRSGPGGHWLDAYPFVQLHQPSANYGVTSTPLGHDRVEEDGPNRGFRELAAGPEICGYYDGVMRRRLLPSGQVRFFPMTEYLGDRRIRSILTGQESEVTVRRRVVDATYYESKVPATDPPPFEVAEGVRCIPLGELVHIDDVPERFVMIGAGKTSMDACTWLLEQGTSPDAITWIRPRDPWLMNRAYFQPGSFSTGTFQGVVHDLEAVVASESPDEAFERLEEAGVMLRLDPDVWPTMAKGPTLSVAERDGLRRIKDVVRLGHVKRIEPDRIELEEGSIPTSPDHVHVHCAAEGIALKAPLPIFEEDTITMQCISRMSPSWAAGVIGFLEASDRSTEEKNRLAPPNPYSDTPFDFLRAILIGLQTEMQWVGEPDLQAWADANRLNVLKDLGTTDDADDLEELQGRFLEAVFPALEKLRKFRDAASPAEQERYVEPAAAEPA